MEAAALFRTLALWPRPPPGGGRALLGRGGAFLGNGIQAALRPRGKTAPAKLRLAFEAAPFSLLVEKAGGGVAEEALRHLAQRLVAVGEHHRA